MNECLISNLKDRKLKTIWSVLYTFSIPFRLWFTELRKMSAMSIRSSLLSQFIVWDSLSLPFVSFSGGEHAVWRWSHCVFHYGRLHGKSLFSSSKNIWNQGMSSHYFSMFMFMFVVLHITWQTAKCEIDFWLIGWWRKHCFGKKKPL